MNTQAHNLRRWIYSDKGGCAERKKYIYLNTALKELKRLQFFFFPPACMVLVNSFHRWMTSVGQPDCSKCRTLQVSSYLFTGSHSYHRHSGLQGVKLFLKVGISILRTLPQVLKGDGTFSSCIPSLFSLDEGGPTEYYHWVINKTAKKQSSDWWIVWVTLL